MVVYTSLLIKDFPQSNAEGAKLQLQFLHHLITYILKEMVNSSVVEIILWLMGKTKVWYTICGIILGILRSCHVIAIR